MRKELYNGARVRLRNGDVILKLEPYTNGLPGSRYVWTGSRKGDGQLFTWTADGKYSADIHADHEKDIVEVLTGARGNPIKTLADALRLADDTARHMERLTQQMGIVATEFANAVKAAGLPPEEEQAVAHIFIAKCERLAKY